MITGLTSATFEKLLLNAGAFLIDFDYSTFDTASALKAAIKTAIASGKGMLGATRGGGSFQATPNMRAIEADGKRYEFIGSMVNDGWTIRMTGTLLEVVPENLKIVLSAADVSDVSENVKKVQIRTDIKASDYIKSLVWVGDTSKGAALINLKNALNTTGANITFTDRGEGTLPFEFNAHQDKVDDYDTAPVEILFFSDPENAQSAQSAQSEQSEQSEQ